MPVLKLMYNSRDVYPQDLRWIFAEEGAWNKFDERVFVGFVSLSRGDVQAKRDRIKEKIRTLFINHYGWPKWQAPFETLIGMLDENNWNVHFFVDAL